MILSQNSDYFSLVACHVVEGRKFGIRRWSGDMFYRPITFVAMDILICLIVSLTSSPLPLASSHFQAMTSLQELDSFLLERLVDFLDVSDVITVSKTSKSMRKFVASLLWKCSDSQCQTKLFPGKPCSCSHCKVRMCGASTCVEMCDLSCGEIVCGECIQRIQCYMCGMGSICKGCSNKCGSCHIRHASSCLKKCNSCGILACCICSSVCQQCGVDICDQDECTTLCMGCLGCVCKDCYSPTAKVCRGGTNEGYVSHEY